MQVLLRVADKINPDSIALDVQCLKRGDIVAIVDDNHSWGTEELTNPVWRIIAAVNLDRGSASSFVIEEQEDDAQNPNPLLQRRAFKFDFSHPGITQSFHDYLADDTRVNPIYTTLWPLADIMALKKPRPTRRNEAQL